MQTSDSRFDKYSTRQVASLLDLPVTQVRRYARADFIKATKNPRGAWQFDFRDLVVLRTAAHLAATRMPHTQVRRTLGRLTHQLPDHEALTEVHVSAMPDRIVAQHGEMIWSPDTGQFFMNFGTSRRASKMVSLVASERDNRREEHRDAAHWFERGSAAESRNALEAIRCYREVLIRDPHHVEARVNLGRLLHDAGNPSEAATHYRAALEVSPDNATAWFNLGVALEDENKTAEAIHAYQHALQQEPNMADAHYNLAHIFERVDRPREALQHLTQYRQLIS